MHSKSQLHCDTELLHPLEECKRDGKTENCNQSKVDSYDFVQKQIAPSVQSVEQQVKTFNQEYLGREDRFRLVKRKDGT